MFLKKLIQLFVFVVVFVNASVAQNALNIIPAPVKAEKLPGVFTINANTKIIAQTNTYKSIMDLN